MELGTLNKSFSNETSYTIQDSGDYTIVAVTNSYTNAGYNIYHNSKVISIMTANLQPGAVGINFQSHRILCKSGDAISLGNFNGKNHNQLYHVLVFK